MDDLLKDAIADAKAVRETALANAKIALEEAFTPRIQSMLSNKIQNELEGDDEAAEEAPVEGEEPEAEEEPEIAAEPEVGEEPAGEEAPEDVLAAQDEVPGEEEPAPEEEPLVAQDEVPGDEFSEPEAEEEAARVAKQEEIAAHKKLLLEQLEQQEDERLRQKHIQRKEKLAEQKWDKQFDTLLAQIKDRRQKDDKLEEIRIIIQNREPSLQKLDWASWLLSDPLNQRLADLDFEHAMEMFKRDNLMAKRRKRTGGKKKYSLDLDNYALVFTGNTPGNTGNYPLAVGNRDHVTTAFDPDDYNLSEGFTVSYWVRPDEFGNTMFALGRKPSQHERFQFGIQDKDDFFVGVGKQRFRTTEHGMGVVPAGEHNQK